MNTDSSSVFTNRYLVLISWIVFGVTFSAAFFNVLSGLISTWYGSDDHSHGFAIVPISLYIVWCKKEDLRREIVHGSWVGLFVSIVSVLGYLLADKAEMVTLTSISMVINVWGAVIFFFGFRIFFKCIFPLTLLFLMIPVPSQIIAALTIPLQLIVTKVSVMLASIIAIPVYREGNVINLPGGTFEVVQACSGLRSIMTMLTLGAVISYFTLRSNLLRSILFTSGIPIAIAANIFRVLILMTSLHYLNINLSEGTPHTILGIAVFGVAVGLFLLLRQGLVRWQK